MSTSNGIQIHTPVPRAFKDKIRERTFYRLGQKALLKAEEIKKEPLTTSEVNDVLDALRAELEKRGFFSDK